MDFLKYPKNIKDLAFELRRVIDLYWARQIDEKDLREIVMYYGLNEGKKIFKANDLNPTVKIIIGCKRADVVSKMLDGLQTKLL